MNRDIVIRLLRAHAGSVRDAHEEAMVDDTLRFVAVQPDCLLRSCLAGHLTGSAWIVSPDRARTLLTYHRKLDQWLQLGGHADGDGNLLAVALREAYEESGLTQIRVVAPVIFDLDRHWVPTHKFEAGHYHYDFRFLFEADPAEPLAVSSESRALAWVELDGVAALNPEESMARMVRKTKNLTPAVSRSPSAE